MTDIKLGILSFFKKTEKIPSPGWLLLLIFLPLNFFLLRERFELKKNSSDWEMAFISTSTQISSNNPLSKILAFSIFSKNKKDDPCQLDFLLNQELIFQKEIDLKSGKKIFASEKEVEEKIIEKKGGHLEIILQCQNIEEDISKNIVF